ncbi:methylated-DNA-[protein]-cysteine S-methyltransferase [Paraburkholderia fungorum]|jgi:methylated-DNA-[protein]-cysteine S-methyltransferase|uniref:methylated-DNA--[protein]-cysteine S-methyltransferase n=1 Tax=Paraburkholderia fungorum TaxID=134537 RepID=UPI000D05A8B9|nr:methylated-DNA--[protein]-cysteine S-methyltransferase [Paraburkholderia fungorum]PRZ46759.1 methylated-DNA-[protein]-cysteine S-methyltransferase [Paraburkholderia fungorum]
MIPCYGISSPLGEIVLRAEDDLLTGWFFVGQKNFPTLSVVAAHQRVPAVIRQTSEQLAEIFAGDRRVFMAPFYLRGTAFQRLVWQELSAIPYGTIASYGAIAQRIGLAGGAARAIGSANAKNPISIIVPCHRVISSTGDLTGYAGGIERKQALLAMERRGYPNVTSHEQNKVDSHERH